MLRDPSLLQPDIRAYLEAENRFAEAILAPTDALQKQLVAEMRGRIKEDDSGVPMPDGPFAYTWKYREGGQHEQVGRLPRDGGDFQTILDGDALAKASDYFKFGGRRHSPDHRLEAWSADLRGSEYFTIRVRRWDSGEDLPDTITQAGGSVVWGRDSTFFFYVLLDDNHRPLKVFRHRLGTPQSDDVLVYEEPDAGWFISYRGKRQRPLLHHRAAAITTRRSSGWSISRTPNAAPRLIAPREKGVRYSVADRGDELFILTNADGAIDFRIATAPLATPDRAHWRELIAHRPGVYILSIELYAGHLVRLERSNALPSIVIRDLATGDEHEHRLRRGGLFARHAERLRIRHDDAPLLPIRR